MDATVEDSYLVRRAQEGYVDAFSELVGRHGAQAFRIAYRLLGDRTEAEDVAQESLVAAWQGLERFKADAAFTTWLYRIVTNRCLNRLSRSRPTRPLESVPEVVDEKRGPAEQAMAAASSAAVVTAVLALPPAQRVPLVLHQFEGLSYAEIAAVTGSTVPAVRSLLFRGRRSLAVALEGWR